MKVRILYGISLLVVIYLNVMYHWEAGRTFLGGMLVLPFLAELLAWLQTADLRVELAADDPGVKSPVKPGTSHLHTGWTVREGETCSAALRLSSRSRLLALCPGSIVAEIELMDGSCHQEKTALSQTVFLAIDTSHPGAWNVRVKKLIVRDVTGLGRGWRLGAISFTVTVLPKVVVPVMEFSETVRGFLIDSDTFSDTKSGDDVSEIFGLREYRPGDSLQRVHWKLSARQESLWVKEYSLPVGAAVVLAAENRSGNKLHDNFLRGFASLVSGFLAYDCPCYVTWRMAESGQIRRFLVREPEDYDEMICAFVADCREGIGAWEEEAYQEMFYERYGRSLVWTEEGSLLDGGETVFAIALQGDFRKQFEEAVIEV